MRYKKEENLTKVTTEDGSITYHNKDIDEQYHSTSGALTEALEKHVKPSGILENKDEYIIVDFCFGLGYNTIVALAEIWKQFPDAHVQVFAFEQDPEILRKLTELKLPEEYKYPFRKIKTAFLNELEEGVCFYENEKITFTLYIGDAREKIKILADEIADVIFFDPFSPKKQDEMWAEDVFVDMFRVLKKGGVLTTYSCAKQARKNMEDAGFDVKDGPVIGRNSPGTLGLKQ